MQRPKAGDFNAYYAGYISLVEGDDPLAALTAQINQTTALLSTLREDQGDYAYAPGKWTIKQMLGHMIDTERIFAHRALCIARQDSNPLPGFEQDDYVRTGDFNQCTLTSLIEEQWAVRRSTTFLFANLQPEAWTRRGVANHNEITVSALAWIIAGHELHHRGVLKDKYLS